MRFASRQRKSRFGAARKRTGVHAMRSNLLLLRSASSRSLDEVKKQPKTKRLQSAPKCRLGNWCSRSPGAFSTCVATEAKGAATAGLLQTSTLFGRMPRHRPGGKQSFLPKDLRVGTKQAKPSGQPGNRRISRSKRTPKNAVPRPGLVQSPHIRATAAKLVTQPSKGNFDSGPFELWGLATSAPNATANLDPVVTSSTVQS